MTLVESLVTLLVSFSLCLQVQGQSSGESSNIIVTELRLGVNARSWCWLYAS